MGNFGDFQLEIYFRGLAGQREALPLIFSELEARAAAAMTPDLELAESFVARAEKAGYRGIVVTLDTWIPGWRPRDLRLGNFPQLQGHCLANYFTDPIFRAKLEKPPEEDPRAAALMWAIGF